MTLDLNVSSSREKRGNVLPGRTELLVLLHEKQFLFHRPRIVTHVRGQVIEPSFTALSGVTTRKISGDPIPIQGSVSLNSSNKQFIFIRCEFVLRMELTARRQNCRFHCVGVTSPTIELLRIVFTSSAEDTVKVWRLQLYSCGFSMVDEQM
jgi:hypothetical protein